ncbi:hypothetical protein FH972_016004 [Carpinus fangiana]|uniref:Uncharacterized protein n=1 Tax=Carpinus fangiana TaxID=176857 RepID=A0A5N6RF30_9ROSI|nr:hypothetical protein FH972_016004 [Carpinus fangiana]
MYHHHMCDVCQHYGWNFISSRLCKIFGGLFDGQSNYARQALLNRFGRTCEAQIGKFWTWFIQVVWVAAIQTLWRIWLTLKGY